VTLELTATVCESRIPNTSSPLDFLKSETTVYVHAERGGEEWEDTVDEEKR